jgi:hypothetical protein
LQIVDSRQIKLITSQIVLEFNIDEYTLSTSTSFTCEGEFKPGARLKGEEPQKGKLKFEWINQEKEIGLWTITMKGEDLKVYFTTQDRIKEYPIITTGSE